MAEIVRYVRAAYKEHGLRFESVVKVATEEDAIGRIVKVAVFFEGNPEALVLEMDYSKIGDSHAN